MSQPDIPDKPDLTREDSINLILASIAMEELGLSHIINAEGEKLQYVLGTGEGTAGPEKPATVEDLLEINKSVRNTLGNATKFQMLLTNKMESAMSEPVMQGPKGEDGESAYQVAVNNGFIGTEDEWLASLKGEKGEQGPTGPTGSTGSTGPQGPEGERGPAGPQGIQGIAGTVGTIKGSYESEQELRNAHPEGGDPGDFYYIKPDLWVWDEDNNDWVDVGEIAGPQGLQGIQGERGDPGPTGSQGPAGPKGETGETGPEGPPGKDGAAATIEAGTVTMLPYNESPTVENVGTSSKAIFNFGIPEGPPRVRVYKANLSTAASPPLQIPLGNAIYYRVQYSSSSELSLFFRPLTGLAQAYCDYRIVSQYNVTFTPFDVYQGNNALFTQTSPAVDAIIYNNTAETHKTWIRVQDPNDPSLWSVYEVNLFSSQSGARVLVWVNVIDEGGSY